MTKQDLQDKCQELIEKLSYEHLEQVHDFGKMLLEMQQSEEEFNNHFQIETPKETHAPNAEPLEDPLDKLLLQHLKDENRDIN